MGSRQDYKKQNLSIFHYVETCPLIFGVGNTDSPANIGPQEESSQKRLE